MNIIEILEGGRLSPSYLNSIDFDTIHEQEKYWKSKVIKNTEIQTPIQYFEEYPVPLSVNFTMEEAINFNYLRIRVNVGRPDSPKYKWYYYFINKVMYNNGTSVLLKLQLDVFQTFMFDYEWMSSFIEREHQDRYDASGEAIINRLEEDIDIGDNVVVSKPTYLGDELLWFHVITKAAIGVKKNSITGEVINEFTDYRATINGLNQAFFHYLIPFDRSNPNKQFVVHIGGKEKLLQSANTIIPSLATSEQTVSIHLLAYSPVPYSFDDNGELVLPDNLVAQIPTNTSFVVADDTGAGGGDTPTGDFHKINYINNGSGETLGPTKGRSGENIPIVVRPGEGQKLVSINLKDSVGTEYPINPTSFIMPNTNVTVTSTFAVEPIKHAINITTNLPDQVIYSSNLDYAFEGEEVKVNIEAKPGWKYDIETDIKYTKLNYGITFMMPNKDVNININVSEVTEFDIYYTIEGGRFIDRPYTYRKGEDFTIKIEAWEGYKLSSNTCYTNDGKKVSGYSKGDPSGKITSTYETAKVNKPVQVQIEFIPKEDPKPTQYTLTIDKTVTGASTSFDEAGYVKVSTVKYKQYDKVRCEVYSYYQTNEYTGLAFEIQGALMFDSSGKQIKPKVIEYQDYQETGSSVKHRYKLVVEYTMPAEDCTYKVNLKSF